MLPATYPKLLVDGIYGPLTKNAYEFVLASNTKLSGSVGVNPTPQNGNVIADMFKNIISGVTNTAVSSVTNSVSSALTDGLKNILTGNKINIA